MHETKTDYRQIFETGTGGFAVEVDTDGDLWIFVEGRDAPVLLLGDEVDDLHAALGDAIQARDRGDLGEGR